MFRLNASQDEYLKAIYTQDPAGAGIHISDIDFELGVPGLFVYFALRGLQKQGLVEHFGNNRYALTPEGTALAREVKTPRELIRLYYVEVLQVNGKTAAEEAEKLEPILSKTSLYAMQRMLEQTTDWKELAAFAPA